MNYALLVIDEDGIGQYLCDGLGDKPTRFTSSKAAKETKEFMLMGMEDECQSINVVPYPKAGKP